MRLAIKWPSTSLHTRVTTEIVCELNNTTVLSPAKPLLKYTVHSNLTIVVKLPPGPGQERQTVCLNLVKLLNTLQSFNYQQ